MAAMLRFCHPTTHRFEDLRPPQFRNHQPEGISARCRVNLDITAGPGAPFNDAGQLKLPQGTSHGGPGGPESFNEFGLAWKALAGFVLTGRDGICKSLPDCLVFRSRGSS